MKSKSIDIFCLCLLLYILTIPGCFTHRPRPVDNLISLLPITIEKGISRENILLTFGAPSMVFQDGRIMTYRLSKTIKRYDIDEEGNHEYTFKNAGIECKGTNRPRDFNKSWFIARYNLVLVFNKENKVEKYRFIKVQ